MKRDTIYGKIKSFSYSNKIVFFDIPELVNQFNLTATEIIFNNGTGR